MEVRTESLRIPNWHDTGSTSPQSVGEVALIWDTISHYSPVLIAPLAIFHRAGASRKKSVSGYILGTEPPLASGRYTIAVKIISLCNEAAMKRPQTKEKQNAYRLHRPAARSGNGS
jgi:hypothetical protein